MQTQSNITTTGSAFSPHLFSELASQFQTHDECFELWVSELAITTEDIEHALEMFDKRSRFKLICSNLKPSRYLVDYPFLIKHVYEMDIEDIKALPPSIYSQHLNQLKCANAISNRIQSRAFPYQDYDAEAFYALRHLKSKGDLKFVTGLYRRSISHHSYPRAKQKLRTLVNGLGFSQVT